uniref:Uncharacterized protein n=1 Tax=Paramormyrops kingsleyae TaxID=1676925 RepID=A0A3B3QB56_9TELE
EMSSSFLLHSKTEVDFLTSADTSAESGLFHGLQYPFDTDRWTAACLFYGFPRGDKLSDIQRQSCLHAVFFTLTEGHLNLSHMQARLR